MPNSNNLVKRLREHKHHRVLDPGDGCLKCEAAERIEHLETKLADGATEEIINRLDELEEDVNWYEQETEKLREEKWRLSHTVNSIKQLIDGPKINGK